MSLTLVATLLCSALPSPTALEFPALQYDGRVAADVGVHVTPTRLVARNYSARPQVLAFVDAESGACVLRPLGVGATIGFDYPTRALESVRIEVLAPALGGWRGSGVFDLSGALVHGPETLWIQSEVRGCAWVQLGHELERASAEPSVLPEGLTAPLAASAAAPACAPAHVPVVTPGDKPRGDAPPKLEDHPLPPV
jgi:hypothetical protein